MFEFSWVDVVIFIVVVLAVIWLIRRLVRALRRPAARLDETETPEWNTTVRDTHRNDPRA